ncbi:porin family protein [Dokdonia sp.]|uniref:porin family protein n=1 Tax=Dokdonia sp. TaxID=2024995 RepID=UPI003266D144
MKKHFLLAILAIMTITSINAQEKISFGVKGGVNFATFGGRDFIVDQKTRTGFHVGVLVEVPISNKFSIQPELMYSQQGSRTESEFATIMNPNDPTILIASESISKFSYINVPILAKYTIVKGLSVEAGPQFGFNIDSELEVSNIISGNETVSTEDISDRTNTFDFGLAVGGEYELPIGLFFQARYILGISNIDSTEVQLGGPNEDSLTNRNFQLSAGYKF